EAASPPQVGLGWATIRFDGTKVRDGKSSDAAVVRMLNEGHRVLVVEVRSKSVRISIPSKGWVKLQRHSEPVLQQEACDVRKPGEASATTQVTNSVLQRLGVMPKPAEDLTEQNDAQAAAAQMAEARGEEGRAEEQASEEAPPQASEADSEGLPGEAPEPEKPAEAEDHASQPPAE
ncbi:unnamed protein product, partial [Symbiodinium sp. CCMP2456]